MLAKRRGFTPPSRETMQLCHQCARVSEKRVSVPLCLPCLPATEPSTPLASVRHHYPCLSPSHSVTVCREVGGSCRSICWLPQLCWHHLSLCTGCRVAPWRSWFVENSTWDQFSVCAVCVAGKVEAGRDLVAFLSHSGGTRECVDAAAHFVHRGVAVLAITGNPGNHTWLDSLSLLSLSVLLSLSLHLQTRSCVNWLSLLSPIQLRNFQSHSKKCPPPP